MWVRGFQSAQQLAVGIVFIVAVGIPLAGADTFVLGGTNGKGGVPSQGELNGLVGQGLIPASPIPIGVDYPAQLWPFSGEMTLDASVRQGVDAIDALLPHSTDANFTESFTVAGTSQGAVVINDEKRRLMARPAADRPPNLTFVTIADPTNSDGGVLSKLPLVHIPILDFSTTRPPVDTPYDTLEIVREYDGVSDWPDDPLNLVAAANALAGGINLHSDYSSARVDGPGNVVTVSPPNAQGGITTHIVVPTKDLPLTQPLRDLGVDGRVVDAIDKPLRKIIDAGYDGPRPGRPDLLTQSTRHTDRPNALRTRHAQLEKRLTLRKQLHNARGMLSKKPAAIIGRAEH